MNELLVRPQVVTITVTKPFLLTGVLSACKGRMQQDISYLLFPNFWAKTRAKKPVIIFLEINPINLGPLLQETFVHPENFFFFFVSPGVGHEITYCAQ